MTRAEVEAILAGTTSGLNNDQKQACGYLAHHVLSGEGLTADHARVLLALLAEFERQRKATEPLCTSLLSHMDRVESAELALAAAVQVAGEAAEEWDKAPEGMRAGKILLALAGHRPRYRPDTDAIHAVLAARKSLAQGGSDERS